jgi:hypothetical protein
MPWKVEHKPSGPDDKRPFKIVRADTGEVVGSSKTEEAAKSSVAARYVAESHAEKGEK